MYQLEKTPHSSVLIPTVIINLHSEVGGNEPEKGAKSLSAKQRKEDRE